MPISGGPGQQLAPKAMRAMPVTRATDGGPVISLPNNNHPTSEGNISSATPVAASLKATKTSTFWLVPERHLWT